MSTAAIRVRYLGGGHDLSVEAFAFEEVQDFGAAIRIVENLLDGAASIEVNLDRPEHYREYSLADPARARQQLGDLQSQRC